MVFSPWKPQTRKQPTCLFISYIFQNLRPYFPVKSGCGSIQETSQTGCACQQKRSFDKNSAKGLGQHKQRVSTYTVLGQSLPVFSNQSPRITRASWPVMNDFILLKRASSPSFHSRNYVCKRVIAPVFHKRIAADILITFASKHLQPPRRAYLRAHNLLQFAVNFVDVNSTGNSKSWVIIKLMKNTLVIRLVECKVSIECGDKIMFGTLNSFISFDKRTRPAAIIAMGTDRRCLVMDDKVILSSKPVYNLARCIGGCIVAYDPKLGSYGLGENTFDYCFNIPSARCAPD